MILVCIHGFIYINNHSFKLLAYLQSLDYYKVLLNFHSTTADNHQINPQNAEPINSNTAIEGSSSKNGDE